MTGRVLAPEATLCTERYRAVDMGDPVDASIDNLMELIEALRGENGCPWDRQQTPHTMILYLIEEAFELLDAIEHKPPDEIREELGDVLFQVFFIARLYQEMGHFGVNDVARTSVEKMTRRHPHVFGDKNIANAEDVKKQWHEMKSGEDRDGGSASILGSVPRRLPALMRAYRISDRAAGAGFEWDDISGVLAKVEEEWDEFRTALSQPDICERHQDAVEMEFGDILFTLVNVARFARIHPETALAASISKFEDRFRRMEARLAEKGEQMGSVSNAELNHLWESVKKERG